MPLSKEEIYHLLYEDDQGNVIGLDEVQLLDPPPLERAPALLELLKSDDLYLVYQAAIVLAAWGEEAGLDKIEELIDMRVHIYEEIAPQRIEDYDNVYDELAYAVHLYGLTGKRPEARERIYGKLLELYGPCWFESKLKYVLLKSDFSNLAPNVRAAIERALSLERAYLASQLLPVLARWEPFEAWQLAPRFINQPSQTPDPMANVAEALGYIKKPESEELLNHLSRHQDAAVAEEARKSLDRLQRD